MHMDTCDAKVDGLEVMKEKLLALSAEELFETALKLSMENQEFHSKNEHLEHEIHLVVQAREREYMRGRIDGLEYSIRCNGVSGAEVR